MNPNEVLDKTDKGQEEIKSRKYKLHAKLRMLLLLVDGNHTAAALTEQATKLALSPAVLDDLREQGYIAEHRAKKPSVASGVAKGVVKGVVPSAARGAPSTGPATRSPAERAHDRYRKARHFMSESVVNVLGLKSFFFTMKIEKTSDLDDLRALLNDYEAAINKAVDAQAAGVLVTRMRSLLKV